ncbi:DUF4347 domain-containing protein [Pseudomonas juntendi]|uniref:DUF4347 domain-containing protein n=1 Tax=Pseudomonas juntendi TaxID=2666183 RepID=UPI001F4083A2|nr:DUF4347 domain-containing protein [Pseudomonas juntendi]
MKFIERFSRKRASKPVVGGGAQPPLLMALEPRIMFDASVGVVAQDAAATTEAATTPAKDSTVANDQQAATPPSEQGNQRNEVVFVDGQVADVAGLLQGLAGNAEVVILDPAKDGLQQMADYLNGREGLDAIHLLSHGADGSVQMGNVWLASNNLAEHRAALQSIGSALKADGDLLLYGCNVGETAKGQAFIDELSAITGADVAASADDTGAVDLGGNWSLERTSGLIESTALGAQLGGYQGLLAASFTGGANPTAPVLASGNLPKMVIGDFNGDGRDDILYQVGSAGSAWKFAAGNTDGSFTVVDQAQSPFAGVVLLDAATNGTNYYTADFDNDGDVDVLGVSNTTGPAYLYRNNNGVFTRETASGFNGTQFGVRLVVGDFNGDGAADILYQPGTVDSANPWRYAQNNGNGTFTDMVQAASPFASFSLSPYSTFNYRVVDFEGDGDLDILYVANNSSPILYRNTGGVFTQVATNAPAATFGGRSIWGDFDGDGDADLFWQVGANGTDWNYATNNGDGTFSTVARSASPFAGLTMVDFGFTNFRTGDFDGDGDSDLIGSAAGVSASVYFQSGSAPRLISASPADDALNVSPGANITLTFNESVTKGSGNIYIVRTSDNTIVQTIDVTSASIIGSGNTWIIDPSDLAQGTAYAVRIDPKTFVNADGKVYLGISRNTTLNFVTATSAAPVIANLNGDTVTYVEKSSGVLLDQSGNAVVTDADSAQFGGGNVRVALTSGGIDNQDVLSIFSTGTAAGQISTSANSVLYSGVIIGTFTGGTSGNPLVVALNANASPAAVSALLQSLVYSNSSTTDPSSGARTVSVTVTDETGTTSTAASVTVNVLAVDDAPVVTGAGSNPTFVEHGAAVTVFSGIAIDTVEPGQSIIGLQVTVAGVADGASEKLIIDGTAVALVSGTAFTSNNGLIVLVSGTGTVTLDILGNNYSTATAQSIINSIAYHNESSAPSGAARVVTLTQVRDTGGATNGGNNTSTPNIASVITLQAVNDAPTLSGGPYVIAPSTEDTSSTAVGVASILASAASNDVDTGGAAFGIAITATTGRGTWQYSTDGMAWTDFGSVSGSSALLLSASSQVRYIPDGANGENVDFTYRAWDNTIGGASANGMRSTADTTSNGGASAFSTGTAQATLVVTSVNDAPVLTSVNPTLTGLTDTATNNTGDPVSSLLGGVTDVDNGALQGIAVTGMTSTYGRWQYSTNAGASWNDIGSASDTAALLLRPVDRVRFVPDGVHGETATIAYRAWDQTEAQGLQGLHTNISSLGGSGAFSSATDTASVLVTAVNDAPVLTGSGGTVNWTEGNNVTSTPVAIDSGIVITDPDGPGISSATVSLGGNYILGEDTLGFTANPATMGDITGSFDAMTGVLTLTSAGAATQAQFQEALRSVTYSNSSDTPTLSTRTALITVNDGGLDSNVVTRSITLTAVNDAPLISAPSNVTVTEDSASPITGITLNDVDSSSGTLTLTVVSGALSATSGSGVTVAGSGSALTLSGSLAAINNFIAAGSLKYTTALNANTSVTLGLSVDTASVGTDTRSLTLDVAPVNDSPTISGPVSINVTEDVPKSLAGVTFGDVDAGTGSVRVVFSVASGNGTFTATSSRGVTVSANGSNAITLEGTVADINTLVSNGRLTFLGAPNATGVKTMSISINDNGNTGSGGALQVNANIALVIAAVNDAPVNNLPVAQTVQQDGALVFNNANGNLISITDVDIGGNVMQLALTASNGLMTLGSLAGLTFSLGDGASDSAMTFSGTLAAINAALNGLTFTPQPGFNGVGSITFESNDQGYSGSGGIKSDVDTLSITIAPANPAVTSVAAGFGDGTYKVGDQIDILVNFDSAVVVDQSGGSPTLLLETGAIDRQAAYIGGSGSNQLVFRYTVQAGDVSADLDYASTAALALNGSTLQGTSGHVAILTLPAVGGADSLAGQQAIIVDGVTPSITNVVLPADATYRLGDALRFTVNFSEAVVVNTAGGTPRIQVTLDTGGIAYADYLAGSGTSALEFALVVAAGQLDANGITVAGGIELNGGSLTDLAGNASDTAFTAGNSSGVLVDGVVPGVASVLVPASGSYKAGDVLSFTVNTSEVVFVGGSPRLALEVGGVAQYATLVAGNGSSSLVFQYTVQAGDTDANGISITSLDSAGGSITDAAGNAMQLALNNVGSTAGVWIDTQAPAVVAMLRSTPSPTGGEVVQFAVTFSEEVSGVDLADFALVLTGSANGTITDIYNLNNASYIVTVSGVTGAGTLGLGMNAAGTGIVDGAGNAISGGFVGEAYTVDRVAPAVISVDVPADGSYVAGQNLDFTVNLGEATVVDTAGGTPRIEVTLDNGEVAYATYVSGSGSTALVFRLSVVTGQVDSDGITLGNAIQLNGGTLRDAIGNNADLALNNVGDTSGVQVDAVVPVVDSVGLPQDGSYKAGDVLTFTVNASESVVVDTTGGTPHLALTVGGVTRYASYVSGAGNGALVFEYTVQAGDNDADGIAVAGSIDLNGGSIKDPAGNDLALSLGAVGSTAGVLVDSVVPGVTSIVRADATPTNGSSISYTVTFSEDVSGVDASDFTVSYDGTAGGSLASVTQVDGRTYTVVIDSLTGEGDVTLALNGSGTGIADAAGNAVGAGLSGETYAVDRTAPSVTSVSVPANGSYVAGQNLDFTVNLSEATLVDTSAGTPRIEVTLDNGQVAYATYLSGSGSTALVFRLSVVTGQVDSDGITLGNAIQLNGGTLRDAVGNDTTLVLNNVGDTSGVQVDAVMPVVNSVGLPQDGSYKVGDVLSFTVNASEGVVVDTTGGTPRLALTVGGVTRYANYVSGAGNGALVFEYTVQAGDNDANGIALAGSIDLNGGSIKDPAGNDLALSLGAVGSAGVLVDTVIPSVTSIVRADATPTNGSSISYTVTFSEDVSGVDASDFTVSYGGTAGGSLASVTQVDGRTYTVVIDSLTGEGDVTLALNGSGTGIADAAGNAVGAGLTGETYSVDRTSPSVTSVSVPANGSYVAGQNLDFTVNLSEATLVDTSAGTPRIEVTLDNGQVAYATYLSGSGSTALVFRLSVVTGQVDSDGITLGNAIQLNGGTLRDAVGNDTTLVLNNVGDTSGVQVDAVVPVVDSVGLPQDGSYKVGDALTFTVNTSESVVVDTTGGTPRLALTVGGVTRYANYVSGAGNGALVFEYTVQAGDNDANGIALAGSIDLNGGSIKDPAGNDLALSLGAVGSAGVLVDTVIPSVTSIVRADATPTNGSSISYTVTFSEDVSGVDASDFTVSYGGTAGGSLASVTQVDGRTYTVVIAGLTGTGGVTLALNSSGTSIADAAGNAINNGLVGETYAVDRTAPLVTSVSVPASGSYVAGQNLDFTVNLGEATLVDTRNGTPRIKVTLDNGEIAYATYLSGSGSTALVFRLTIASGQQDSDGITLGSAIELNGGTLRDALGNNADPALNGIADSSGVQVDAIVPVIDRVSLPANGNYKAGDVLTFTVSTSEPVLVDTSSGTPRLALVLGGVTRYAQYVSGSGSAQLVFAYTIEPGNNASGGVALGASMDLNGATLGDAAGNALNLALGNPGTGSGIIIDTTAPQVSDIVRVDTTPTNAGTLRYTVTFDESVSGVDSADFTLAFTGSASGRIAGVQQVDGRTYIVTVDSLAGVGNVRLDLNPSSTGIEDASGNPVRGGLAGSVYSVDRVAPSVTHVAVPASGTYVAGQYLDFIVSTDEAVLVDTGDGAPRLAITLDDGRVAYADYLAGSGSNSLVFRLNVTSGMAGNNSLSVGTAIDLNGGSIRDARGNQAQATLNNVDDTRGILVDARAPRASSIVVDGPVLPTDRSISFTLTFDEAVSGVDASDFSVLGTSSASGDVQTVQRIDATTYRIVVGNLRGQGALALSLNALGSGIQDSAGNTLATSLVSPAQSTQAQDVGDLQYRLNPPQLVDVPQAVQLQPQVPGMPANAGVSPLLPASLFEVRSVGGDLQPLGTIFLANGGSAPSFIAQVFGSSDSSAGQGGFAGFGNGGNSVFGSSTLAAIFNHDVPGVSALNVFNGTQWRPAELEQGLRGVFGAPSFSQQLQQLNESELRQVRDLAQALAQPAQIGRQA